MGDDGRPGYSRRVSGGAASRVVLGLSAVIVAVTGEQPRILTVGAGPCALPSGTLDPAGDRTLERALRRWVAEQTGIDLGYVEQLYTLGDRGRGPVEGERLVTVAYLALVREGPVPDRAGARWRDWYDFFPWEDFREGASSGAGPGDSPRPGRLGGGRRGRGRPGGAPRAAADHVRAGRLAPGRGAGAGALRAALRGRAGAGGGRAGGLSRRGRPWRWTTGASPPRRWAGSGASCATARWSSSCCPGPSPWGSLQRVVEALSGVRLHSQNFRRLVARGRLVEATGGVDTSTGGRPAAVYRFRREVLRERPAPGLGLPGLRTSG